LDRVLVDTSAWIEFFRKKEPVYSQVMELIDSEKVCCLGIILAELLQGSRSDKEIDTLREFLHVFDFLPESVKVWERAGVLSSSLQRTGKRVGLADCYIAAAAKTNEVVVLTLDEHFSVLARENAVDLHRG
jgi:tRNA(fMet)-specific endonuclease VapC